MVRGNVWGETMSEDKKYNGWTNYETWKLALNLDNDEGVYRDVRVRNTEWTGDELKEYLEEAFEFEDVGYKICDFWSYHEWNEIDFDAVAESINVDIREANKGE